MITALFHENTGSKVPPAVNNKFEIDNLKCGSYLGWLQSTLYTLHTEFVDVVNK
jgi:hypothetical protein